jgi:hypothetical protein
MRYLLPLALLVLAACGGTTVGRTCTQDKDCDNGQTCYLFVTGGYCSKGCGLEGSTQDCPGGTVCVLASGQLYCANTCQSQGDCRAELECNGVTGSAAKACRPKSK